MSASYFNYDKKGFGSFVWDKFLRLLVPMFIAVPLFLWPRQYLDQKVSGLLGNHTIDNPFKYFGAMCKDLLAQLDWLWFLAALFVVMVVNFPMIAWTFRRKRGDELDSTVDNSIIAL